MNGVLIRLLDETICDPSTSFGKIFSVVLADLDRLDWHAPYPPWMGAPPHFDEGEVWRRGGLGRYWRDFSEEEIELWGFASSSPFRINDEIDEKDARAMLLYRNCTCWELYTDLPKVAERVFDHVQGKPQYLPARARFDRRGEAFGFVGLSHIWRPKHGRR